MTTLATLILTAFAVLAAASLLGFPTRTLRQSGAHGVNLIFEVLQRRCAHDPRYVSADILEGCGGDTAVSACRRCGAVKVIYGVHSKRDADGAWREPRASWTSDLDTLLRERRREWQRANGEVEA